MLVVAIFPLTCSPMLHSSTLQRCASLGVVSKRLPHSTVIGWGSLFGHKPKRPSPVTLQGLPEGSPSKGPFDHVFVAAGAGQTHVCFVCEGGEVVMMGGNRYGQAGRPSGSAPKPSFAQSGLVGEDVAAECTPLYFDLGFPPQEAPNAVACGSNYSLIYRKGGQTVVGVGNNHMGQQGIGHKASWSNEGGFAQWETSPSWATREPYTVVDREVVSLCRPELPVTDSEQETAYRKRMQRSRMPGESWESCYSRNVPLTIPAPIDTPPTNDLARFGIKEIVCGTNHTLIWLNNDVVYACGSNLSGELGLGQSTSPMAPAHVWSLDRHVCRVEGVHRDDVDAQRAAIAATPKPDEAIAHLGTWEDIRSNRKLKQVACGNGFSLFLVADGRVYGCGSNKHDQIGHMSPEVEAVNPSRINPEDYQSLLVKVKLIAAMSDMAVFVSTSNEVLVRGGMEGVGVFTLNRLHAVLPLPSDVLSEAKVAALLQKRDAKRAAKGLPPLSASAREELSEQYRQRHPPIAAVWGQEKNVFLQYDDGRIVGFGVNLDSQVQIVDGPLLLMQRRLNGEADGSVNIAKAVNYAPGSILDRVALVGPPCPQIVGRTHLAVGLGFVMMVIEGDAPYEDVLAYKYRRERDLKRSVGIEADDVVMSDILLPPVVPEEANPPPADFDANVIPNLQDEPAPVAGAKRDVLPGRRGVLSKALFRNVPTSAPPGAYGAPLPASSEPKRTAPKRTIMW